MEKTKLKKKIQSWIIRSLNDPIVKILHKNSNITKIQLETLLIDLLSENISGKDLIYEEKALMRLKKSEISRGSFNRTLKQAKKNVIESIYTLLLLGYLGLFENTKLNPYLEISSKLHRYMEAYKEVSNQKRKNGDRLKAIKMIREELEVTLREFSDI